jgi:hypothetical protein
VVGRNSLWLGKDHLLSVINRGYTEEYKRFYRSDIQAIVAVGTSAYLVFNLIFGTLLAFSAVMNLLAWKVWDWDPVLLIVWSVFPGISLMFLLYNLFLGSSCETHLVTAVHRERLRSLNRMRNVRRVMRVLKPWVEEEQGAMALDQVLSVPGRGGIRQAPAPTVGKLALQPYNGVLHLAMFVLLFAESAMNVASLYSRSLVFVVARSSAYLAVAVLLILCLVRARRSVVPRRLGTLTWSTLVYLWLVSALGSLTAMVFAMAHPETVISPLDLFREMLMRSPVDSRPWLLVRLFELVVSLSIATAGMITALRLRGRNRESEIQNAG